MGNLFYSTSFCSESKRAKKYMDSQGAMVGFDPRAFEAARRAGG